MEKKKKKRIPTNTYRVGISCSICVIRLVAHVSTNPDLSLIRCVTFHRYICSNITATPSYRIYISKLIRYSRACITNRDILDGGMLISSKLINQRFKVVKLSPILRQIIGRHHNWVTDVSIVLTIIQFLSFEYDITIT